MTQSIGTMLTVIGLVVVISFAHSGEARLAIPGLGLVVVGTWMEFQQVGYPTGESQ